METRFGDNVLIEKAAPGHSAGAMDVSRYRSQAENHYLALTPLAVGGKPQNRPALESLTMIASLITQP
jgi:hypothetical protein